MLVKHARTQASKKAIHRTYIQGETKKTKGENRTNLQSPGQELIMCVPLSSKPPPAEVKTNRDRGDVTPSGVRCQRRREGPGCVLNLNLNLNTIVVLSNLIFILTQALEITFVLDPTNTFQPSSWFATVVIL